MHKAHGLRRNGTVIADDLSAFLDSDGRPAARSPVTRFRRAGEYPVALGQDQKRRLRRYRTEPVLSEQLQRHRHPVAWVNASVDYNRRQGQLNRQSPISRHDAVVNGISLGDIEIVHGTRHHQSRPTALRRSSAAAERLPAAPAASFGQRQGRVSQLLDGRTIDIANTIVSSRRNYLKRIDGAPSN